MLYIRNEVILPNVGHHGEGFVPFCLTLFFFILFCNLLGLIPYGATATSNISVTATLAIVSFFVIEIAGMRALGMGYIKTIVYWPHDMPLAHQAADHAHHDAGRNHRKDHEAARARDSFVREHDRGARRDARADLDHLHVRSCGRSMPAPVLAATGIMMLEIFVAFLQAFVFCLLVSVFIGQIRESAH